MQPNPPHPIPAPASQAGVPETPSAGTQIPSDDPTSSAHFDWSDFLDFNLDENLSISFPQSENEQPGIDQSHNHAYSGGDKPGRVRKRDPRLVCSNFLAGRVPCACPELDEKLEEEEAFLPGKKRTRMVRVPGGAPARCQVTGCEADISELKGYHKRHRVCLPCANARSVMLDGESKRYCQQCGKFHVLPDFDEGKRSCRRKLERHNNRRRRKPNDYKEGVEKESQQSILADDVSGDDDAGTDGICVTSQIEEREMMLEPDGRVTALCSVLDTHNIQNDSVVSFAPSDETHIDADNQNPKYNHSPSYCDNRSTFTSVCPAGRISFKLYDWNPAEFPRRLRLQIFQWLANMPVELEGYIRPGCTILTAFIAMPKPVWLKLLEEPALCIKELVASPGSMLSGRGTMHFHLNDMIFRVANDATSVVKIKVKDRAPKLHYIYPTFFEAGRPMEFLVCGSYLLQPDFRFLVSFAGRYLAYNICVSSTCEREDANTDHQLLKIYVPQINVDIFGPVFIEVENQSGLSNFIPILVGDRETCAEMEILQQKFAAPFSSQGQKLSPTKPSCEDFALRQARFSDFVLDVAWLLKKPVSKQQLTSSHVQRFNYVLNFLIERESYVVLERVFCALKCSLDNLVAGISDADMRLLWKNMDIAQNRLAQRLLEKDSSVMRRPNGNFYGHRSQNDTLSVIPAANQGVQTMKNMLSCTLPSPSLDEDAKVPLLRQDVIMNVNLQERPEKSTGRLLTRTFWTSRPLLMAVLAIGVCFGVCAVVLHPQRIGQIATTLQRCLFDYY